MWESWLTMRAFSGISRLPRPCIPALLTYSIRCTLIGSQEFHRQGASLLANQLLATGSSQHATGNQTRGPIPATRASDQRTGPPTSQGTAILHTCQCCRILSDRVKYDNAFSSRQQQEAVDKYDNALSSGQQQEAVDKYDNALSSRQQQEAVDKLLEKTCLASVPANTNGSLLHPGANQGLKSCKAVCVRISPKGFSREAAYMDRIMEVVCLISTERNGTGDVLAWRSEVSQERGDDMRAQVWPCYRLFHKHQLRRSQRERQNENKKIAVPLTQCATPRHVPPILTKKLDKVLNCHRCRTVHQRNRSHEVYTRPQLFVELRGRAECVYVRGVYCRAVVLPLRYRPVRAEPLSREYEGPRVPRRLPAITPKTATACTYQKVPRTSSCAKGGEGNDQNILATITLDIQSSRGRKWDYPIALTGQGKLQIPKKTRRPTASCGNPGVTPAGIELVLENLPKKLLENKQKSNEKRKEGSRENRNLESQQTTGLKHTSARLKRHVSERQKLLPAEYERRKRTMLTLIDSHAFSLLG
ncbi:hypothetical protein PR048_014284 [Dryococelus australis]|uniref:Uncharacterized protein n=1 Tax=Dryococelus australis TaxID=614101 RepID=A0ABQ9HDZ1_9NEOP|nr:hypothetical protein PR048_014284 [Dryococelus australis]